MKRYVQIPMLVPFPSVIASAMQCVPPTRHARALVDLEFRVGLSMPVTTKEVMRWVANPAVERVIARQTFGGQTWN